MEYDLKQQLNRLKAIKSYKQLRTISNKWGCAMDNKAKCLLNVWVSLNDGKKLQSMINEYKWWKTKIYGRTSKNHEEQGSQKKIVKIYLAWWVLAMRSWCALIHLM